MRFTYDPNPGWKTGPIFYPDPPPSVGGDNPPPPMHSPLNLNTNPCMPRTQRILPGLPGERTVKFCHTQGTGHSNAAHVSHIKTNQAQFVCLNTIDMIDWELSCRLYTKINGNPGILLRGQCTIHSSLTSSSGLWIETRNIKTYSVGCSCCCYRHLTSFVGFCATVSLVLNAQKSGIWQLGHMMAFHIDILNSVGWHDFHGGIFCINLICKHPHWNWQVLNIWEKLIVTYMVKTWRNFWWSSSADLPVKYLASPHAFFSLWTYSGIWSSQQTMANKWHDIKCTFWPCLLLAPV